MHRAFVGTFLNWVTRNRHTETIRSCSSNSRTNVSRTSSQLQYWSLIRSSPNFVFSLETTARLTSYTRRFITVHLLASRSREILSLFFHDRLLNNNWKSNSYSTRPTSNGRITRRIYNDCGKFFKSRMNETHKRKLSVESIPTLTTTVIRTTRGSKQTRNLTMPEYLERRLYYFIVLLFVHKKISSNGVIERKSLWV